MQKALVISGLLLAALGLALYFRFAIGAFLQSLGGPPELREEVALGPGERWFDDYYTVTEIGPRTTAIGEPRYPGAVYSYLLEGEERALLFDSGLPRREIAPVVASLTELPVTVLASHLHFDHVGNHEDFDSVLMPDLPEIRERIEEGRFEPTRLQHLGYVEGVPRPSWRIRELVLPGSVLELGGRSVRVLHTPGHTSDSISLWDAERGLLLAGDTLYAGALWAFLPSSSLPDYLQTAERLLEWIPPGARIYGAHTASPEGLPLLGRGDLLDLRDLLRSIREGRAEHEGLLPAVYRVNETVTLETDLPWLHGWD